MEKNNQQRKDRIIGDSRDYTTSQRMKYKSEQVWFPLSEDILAWDNDFHELMLRDHIRMTAYEAAIKERVKPDMTVLDLGTGTGILALWALEAGARKVYGVDVNPNRISQALERIDAAGYGDKFQIYNALSYNVELPERVDAVVSEILGNLGDNEDMCRILNDAHSRFLKPRGFMLPSKVTTSLVPISSPEAHAQIAEKCCKGVNSSYNLSNLLHKLEVSNQFNLYYDAILPKSTYLGTAQAVRTFYFQGGDDAEYGVDRTFEVTNPGKFTGFKGSFSADLSERVCLDISGDRVATRETSDCWKHCYFPIEDPVDVKKGDSISLTYGRTYPSKPDSVFRQIYFWEGNVTRGKKVIASFRQRMGD